MANGLQQMKTQLPFLVNLQTTMHHYLTRRQADLDVVEVMLQALVLLTQQQIEYG